MSTRSLSDQDRVHRKSTQRRNNSGELDVFEATRYFSGCNEAVGYNGVMYSHKTAREERQALGGRRMSLDMPTAGSFSSSQSTYQVERQTKEKKSKQPSSPGGRLASFLNSLFQQAASKKKKSKSMKDEDESPGGRRKRRSSISLFQTNTNDSKSHYASSTASGFRTPPSYVDTPTKGSYKDLKSYSDHKHIVSLQNYNGKVKSVLSSQDEKKNMDLAWLDEKFKFIDNKSNKILIDKFSSKNVKRDAEVDDGGESDSSSDLFELENYDLGDFASDLPVYETTNMEGIKRGAPITNCPL